MDVYVYLYIDVCICIDIYIERCNWIELGWVRRHSQPNPYFRVILVGNPNNLTQHVKYGLGC